MIAKMNKRKMFMTIAASTSATARRPESRKRLVAVVRVFPPCLAAVFQTAVRLIVNSPWALSRCSDNSGGFVEDPVDRRRELC